MIKEKKYSSTDAAENILSVCENDALSFKTCQRFNQDIFLSNMTLGLEVQFLGILSYYKPYLWETLSKFHKNMENCSIQVKLRTCTSVMKSEKNKKRSKSVFHHLSASKFNQRVPLYSSLKSRHISKHFPC